jgi:hypothetical protein
LIWKRLAKKRTPKRKRTFSLKSRGVHSHAMKDLGKARHVV